MSPVSLNKEEILKTILFEHTCKLNMESRVKDV